MAVHRLGVRGARSLHSHGRRAQGAVIASGQQWCRDTVRRGRTDAGRARVRRDEQPGLRRTRRHWSRHVFLLPDFKPPAGSSLFGAAEFIRELYTWWDENFLEPWEDTLGPVADNTWDQLSESATGGLLQQLGDLATNAIAYLLDRLEVLITRQYDVFGILGSGVSAGVDEQTFFWSDMLHYRRTFAFGRTLYEKARASGDDRQLAYALGWMSHLATDVTGHAFTNEKCGGPYRLHWQRHKLVENHMDAKVYDSEHGANAIYNMLNNSAQHLWIAFNPDDSSRHDCFAAQPGPTYPTGDETPDILARKAAWNVDSEMLRHLAEFLSEALRETYNDAAARVADPKGHVASHPTILEDTVPGSGGFANVGAIETTYWWLYPLPEVDDDRLLQDPQAGSATARNDRAVPIDAGFRNADARAR